MDNQPNRVREMRATFKVDSDWGNDPKPKLPVNKLYRAKVFKSGNSLALRLPAELGLEAGMEMALAVEADGSYAVRRIEPAKRGIDVSGFAGKCPWLKPLPRDLREFDERPSTIAARKRMGGT